MNISVVHHFELAITFGAPLPYIRRAYLIAAPRTMHHLQYAAIPGYFPAMAVFSAYFHLSYFVSYSSIVFNICNATCGTMAFPQAKPPMPLKREACVIRIIRNNSYSLSPCRRRTNHPWRSATRHNARHLESSDISRRW